MKYITDTDKVLTAAKKYVDVAKLPDENSTDGESFIRRLMRETPDDSRFDLFRDIQSLLDADGRAIALAAIWPFSVTGNMEPCADGYCTKEEIIEWFASCNPEKLMDSINFKLLSRLPDVITVFRGMNGLSIDDLRDLEPADAVSWTINPIVTILHQDDRFGLDAAGNAYKASIKKEDVLAYFCNADMEIVLNPNKLFDIKEINDAGEMLSNGDPLDLVGEQLRWQSEYVNNETYRELFEKLEPLGRVNELIEATMDFEKRKALVKELLGRFL